MNQTELIMELLKQITKSPEDLVETIHSVVEKYKPVAYSICKEVVDMYDDYANNKEYPVMVATARKNQFDAYINAGFSEDQAIAFIINDNIQLMKYAQKATNNSSKISTKK